MALLEIEDLSVAFPVPGGLVQAVDRLSLSVGQGEILGVVGESGSGKSVAMLAAMGLLPLTARITAGRLAFQGADLRTLSPRERRKISGGAMAMIFQEPMTSLNPCFTVGFQITEALSAHLGGKRRDLREEAARLLARVGIPDPERRLKSFPHQFSGGMCQRVMIAMAIACRPKLLIADEPTTALDVTIQAQILDLLRELARESGMAMVLITHDMGVVAETADRIAVMYAGQLVETQGANTLFTAPRHPYAASLLAALPDLAPVKGRLATIPGMVPDLSRRPPGCLFAPRCFRVASDCTEGRPALCAAGDGAVRCLHPLEAA